eukprot:TRINITY_DN30218_c1_g1_i4.p1 TRINITY_DN30218_c1_g1~~TRINITY_DN30218_c1_g1_i4.p1  ORF type:complete len:254 (-),score=27.68 TRINITY_DN30218_c1_g1_i4:336-986(-)
MKSVNVRYVTSDRDMLACGWLRALSFAPTIPTYQKAIAKQEYFQIKNQLNPQNKKEKSSDYREEYISILAECEENQLNEQLGIVEDEYENLRLENQKIALGTFDIVLTRALNREKLLGNCSSIGYLANYCVVSFARRQGVASLLIGEARRLACLFGAEALFVHVKANNNPSISLFQKNQFIAQEEPETPEKLIVPLFQESGDPNQVILFRDGLLWQ